MPRARRPTNTMTGTHVLPPTAHPQVSIS
eukprot:SAG22_NODE_2621_length_2366_cov_3.295986_2_plen_28_part_01